METKTKAKSTFESKTKPKKEIPLRDNVKSKLNQNEENNFDISIMLSDIYHGSLYQNWVNPKTGSKYEKFEEYCNTDLYINYRTAMWYVGNGDGIKRASLTKTDVAGIGFSVFKEISNLLVEGMSRDEALEILAHVQDKSFRQVQDFVKSTKLSQETVGKSQKRVYNFNNDQIDTIESAHRRVQELTGITNPNLQLEYIVADWLVNNSDEFNEAVMESLKGSDEEAKKAPHKTHANKGKAQSASAVV